MSMPFSQPSSGDWFAPKDAFQHLILVTKVHEIGTKFDRLSNGDKPHGVFDMVDLDAPGQPLQMNMNDSHPGIVNKLAKALRTGEMVLGRINQAPSDKGNPAWILDPFTPGHDDARATAWLNANPLNNFGQATGRQPQQYAPPATSVPPQPQQQYAQAPQQQYQAPQPPPQQYGQTPQQQYPPQGMPPQQYAPQQAPAPAAPPQQYAPQQAAAPAPQPQQQYPAPPAPAAPAPGQPPLDPNNLPPEVQALIQNLQNGGQQPTG